MHEMNQMVLQIVLLTVITFFFLHFKEQFVYNYSPRIGVHKILLKMPTKSKLLDNLNNLALGDWIVNNTLLNHSCDDYYLILHKVQIIEHAAVFVLTLKCW